MQIEDTQASAAELLGAVEVHGSSRADFILGGALAAGAAFGLTAVGPFVSSALGAALTDVDIVNFALKLEYLETNFYTVKAKAVGLSGAAKSYAAAFGGEEAEHVSALLAAVKSLGGKPAAMPSFTFPATDETSFLALAYVLENVGVAAYNGAGPSIKNKKILAAAGSIVQVEARHAATIGALTNKPVTPDGAFDKSMTVAQVLKAAGPFFA